MDEEVKSEGGELQVEEHSNTSLDEQVINKEERLEKEKQELLNRVVTGQIKNLKDRVAFILNNSNEARNSDVELAWLYWENFEHDKFFGSSISKEQMKNLTGIASLSRSRAKIQNEYKLFQADDLVKQYRGKLEEDKKSEAIEDKPSGLKLYTVYIDETGKTQDYLSVGSLWVLKLNISAITVATYELQNWKKHKEIDFEFHFKDLSKNRLPLYKEFFIKFLTLFPETGFKIVVLNNKGFKDKMNAITDLTYHLIIKGILHEHETGRAPLPRVLQVYIDEEEKGSDQLKIENIKERLTSQKIDGLYLGNFEAVSSINNFYIQIIDLFTGAVNRKLHSSTETNIKDEFASFVLGILQFNIDEINKQNSQVDNSKLFNLADIDPSSLNNTP